MRPVTWFSKIILIAFTICPSWIVAQDDVGAKVVELQKQLDDLNKLYTTLKVTMDGSQNQTDKGFQSLNKKLEDLSNESESKYSKVNSRAESIEKTVKISDEEKKKYLAQNVDRNQVVQENFYQYIKFYGDKYSQLDEKLTSEELSLELRKIINPQSGSLGFKLSDRLNETMKKQFYSMVDEVMKDEKDKKDHVKVKIDNALSAVTSTLANPVISDVIGTFPFGSSVKNIVGTVSGLIVNIFDNKQVKEEFKGRILEKMKTCQDAILKDLKDIISFYDKMAKLDNQYEISLQNIRNDVGILGIELKEFCTGLETPLKKVDASFAIDKTRSVREISIQVSDKFDMLRSDKDMNTKYLSILTNVSFEIKNRSRDLYSRYRGIQESKIIANNKFVKQFTEIIGNSHVTTAPITTSLSDRLDAKNAELINKMNSNHAIDKIEFEKYLDKISELN